MENTITVPARAIETGDKIMFEGKVYTVMFAALSRGIYIELKLKQTGLAARTSAEKVVVVAKTKPIYKMV